jgi:hypothetical protein
MKARVAWHNDSVAEKLESVSRNMKKKPQTQLLVTCGFLLIANLTTFIRFI